MPYLLLGIGVLLGLYGLYRFFLNADVRQVKALFLSGAFAAVALAMFFLAFTGRLPAALALLAALWPLGVSLRRYMKRQPSDPAAPAGPMTRAEALEILGLSEGATKEDIKAAHKKLIKKTHPDQEGSPWLAARVNQARDILLR